MRAEAAVPHADPELRAEPGRHQRVVHPVHGEGRHGQTVVVPGAGLGPRSEHVDTLDGAQPVVQLRRQRRLVGTDGVPADPLQLVHGRAEGDGPDDVGRAGLLAFGGFGPDHLVQVDQVDGAPAGQEGIAGLEDAPRADERAGAEGRVELVPAEGHEVGSRRQGSVGRQLGRIEQDGDAPLVRRGADLLDRWQPARHVGSSRHGQQRRPPPVVEHPDHVGRVERAVGAALDPAPRCHPRPGQQVGVVLDHGRGHHVVGPSRSR